MTEAIDKKQRIEKWDIARGILIFLVVLGHFVDYYTSNSVRMRALFLFIYSFHMPCFLFLDGLFSKRNVDEKRYTHIFSYLILYLFTNILITLTTGIINHKFNFSLLSESGLPWYGLVLFFCNLATIFLKRFPKKWVLLASILLACFVGYDSSISDFLSLSRVFVFFPFFFLGYCIDPVQLMAHLSSLRAKISGMLILLILAAICFFATDSIYFARALITGRNPFNILSETYGMENLAYWGCICRFIYYIITFTICMAFLAIIPTNDVSHANKYIPTLSAIGRRSLQIYILHRPVIYILYNGLHLNEWFINNGFSNIIIIPLAVLLTLFLGTKFFEKPINAIIYPWKWKDSSS